MAPITRTSAQSVVRTLPTGAKDPVAREHKKKASTAKFIYHQKGAKRQDRSERQQHVKTGKYTTVLRNGPSKPSKYNTKSEAGKKTSVVGGDKLLAFSVSRKGGYITKTKTVTTADGSSSSSERRVLVGIDGKKCWAYCAKHMSSFFRSANPLPMFVEARKDKDLPAPFEKHTLTKMASPSGGWTDLESPRPEVLGKEENSRKLEKKAMTALQKEAMMALHGLLHRGISEDEIEQAKKIGKLKRALDPKAMDKIITDNKLLQKLIDLSKERWKISFRSVEKPDVQESDRLIVLQEHHIKPELRLGQTENLYDTLRRILISCSSKKPQEVKFSNRYFLGKQRYEVSYGERKDCNGDKIASQKINDDRRRFANAIPGDGALGEPKLKESHLSADSATVRRRFLDTLLFRIFGENLGKLPFEVRDRIRNDEELMKKIDAKLQSDPEWSLVFKRPRHWLINWFLGSKKNKLYVGTTKDGWEREIHLKLRIDAGLKPLPIEPFNKKIGSFFSRVFFSPVLSRL